MASVHSTLFTRPPSLGEPRATFSDSHEASLPRGASGANPRFAQRDTGIISPPFDRRIQYARLKYKAPDKVQSGARLSTGRSSVAPAFKTALSHYLQGECQCTFWPPARPGTTLRRPQGRNPCHRRAFRRTATASGLHESSSCIKDRYGHSPLYAPAWPSERLPEA